MSEIINGQPANEKPTDADVAKYLSNLEKLNQKEKEVNDQDKQPKRQSFIRRIIPGLRLKPKTKEETIESSSSS